MKASCSDPSCGFQDEPHCRGTKLNSCSNDHEEVWFDLRHCPLCEIRSIMRETIEEIETERDCAFSARDEVQSERDDAIDRANMYEDEISDLRRNSRGSQRTIIEDGI